MGFRAGSVSVLFFSILRRPLLRALPLMLCSGIVLRPVDDSRLLRPRNRKVLGLPRAEHRCIALFDQRPFVLHGLRAGAHHTLRRLLRLTLARLDGRRRSMVRRRRLRPGMLLGCYIRAAPVVVPLPGSRAPVLAGFRR